MTIDRRNRCRVFSLEAARVCVFVLAAWPLAAQAGQSTAQAAAPEATVDEASRLTWSQDTRPEGIAALRSLVARGAGAEARLELGRVLTWNVATRAEGTQMLRALAEEHPERGDVATALAEVLSWNSGTRDEAIRRLRTVVTREPDRTPARLVLAEVLSWNRATRDESESLYRSVLRASPSAIGAKAGLAQLLSWRGRVSESKALFREALRQAPENVAARVGLADAERQSGRTRAALATLSSAPAVATRAPGVLQRRAEAYAQIGRPARALAAYEALLAVEPTNTVALAAARDIRRGLAPQIEIGGDGSTESGDPSSSRVRSSEVPLRISVHPGRGDGEVFVRTAVASHWNSRGRSRQRSAAAGFDTPLGTRARLAGEVAVLEFDQQRRDLTGRVETQLAATDRLSLTAAASRQPVLSSRLSVVGEETDGVRYGPAFSNELSLKTAGRLGRHWDLWAQGVRGRVEGLRMAPNDHEALLWGLSRSVGLGPVSLRPGYSATWLSYRRDLAGFPATDLGGDGLTRRGVGGYFSPARFVNHTARLDVTLALGRTAMVVAGGGMGRQQVQETRSSGLSPRIGSSDAYLGFTLPVGGRISLRGQMSYQNVASAFNRTVGRLSIGWAF